MNFRGNAGVSDERMDGRNGADQRGADGADLLGIGDDDDLLGVANHGKGDGGLLGFEGGDAAFEIESGDADEGLVEVDVAQEVERGLAGEGEGPGPGEGSAGEHGFDGGLVAELHTDVQRIGDDGDATAMAEGAAHLGGGGAGGEADGLLFADQLGGGEADAALLIGGPEFAGLKGGVVAKWL